MEIKRVSPEGAKNLLEIGSLIACCNRHVMRNAARPSQARTGLVRPRTDSPDKKCPGDPSLGHFLGGFAAKWREATRQSGAPNP